MACEHSKADAAVGATPNGLRFHDRWLPTLALAVAGAALLPAVFAPLGGREMQHIARAFAGDGPLVTAGVSALTASLFGSGAMAHRLVGLAVLLAASWFVGLAAAKSSSAHRARVHAVVILLFSASAAAVTMLHVDTGAMVVASLTFAALILVLRRLGSSETKSALLASVVAFGMAAVLALFTREGQRELDLSAALIGRAAGALDPGVRHGVLAIVLAPWALGLLLVLRNLALHSSARPTGVSGFILAATAAVLLTPPLDSTASLPLALSLAAMAVGRQFGHDFRTSIHRTLIPAALALQVGGAILCGVFDAAALKRDFGQPLARALAGAIGGIAETSATVLVLGVPESLAGGAADVDLALHARRQPPFSRAPLDLRLLRRGDYASLPAGLLDSNRATLICEWRPSAMFALGTEPRGWAITPILEALAPASPDRLRLVAPADGARRSTDRPRTIGEDMSFVFESREPLRSGESFVFYAVYEGGFTPKGRGLLSARPLSARVLDVTRAGDTVLYSWRTSIRAGDGHEGVPFDDPDLEIAGKPFWWTIGIAASAASDHDHDHDHASCGVNATSLLQPRLVAQTRRIDFAPPAAYAR